MVLGAAFVLHWSHTPAPFEFRLSKVPLWAHPERGLLPRNSSPCRYRSIVFHRRIENRFSLLRKFYAEYRYPAIFHHRPWPWPSCPKIEMDRLFSAIPAPRKNSFNIHAGYQGKALIGRLHPPLSTLVSRSDACRFPIQEDLSFCGRF